MNRLLSLSMRSGLVATPVLSSRREVRLAHDSANPEFLFNMRRSVKRTNAGKFLIDIFIAIWSYFGTPVLRRILVLVSARLELLSSSTPLTFSCCLSLMLLLLNRN